MKNKFDKEEYLKGLKFHFVNTIMDVLDIALLKTKVDKPVCIRLLNRIWYRLIMILDRMADDSGDAIGAGLFQGEVIEVRMNCFGAPFPYGDCGQVLMEFSVEGLR